MVLSLSDPLSGATKSKIPVPTSISIDDEFEKSEMAKKDHYQKILGMNGMIKYLIIFLSLRKSPQAMPWKEL